MVSCLKVLKLADAHGQRDCQGLHLILLLIIPFLAGTHGVRTLGSAPGPSQPSADGHTAAAWQGL